MKSFGIFFFLDENFPVKLSLPNENKFENFFFSTISTVFDDTHYVSLNYCYFVYL